MDEIVEFFDRSSWGLMLARVHDVSSADVVFWIGVAVVVACLIAAAVAVFKYGQWITSLVLLLVAIVAAFLLL